MSQQEQIINALSNPKFSWRTLDGVSRETGLKQDEILKFIESNPNLFIKSRISDEKGRALYATREHYRKSNTIWQRTLDQFKST
jgi:hypothetical protein